MKKKPEKPEESSKSSLYKFILETELELAKRKRRMDTLAFKTEIAINNVLFAMVDLSALLRAEREKEKK